MKILGTRKGRFPCGRANELGSTLDAAFYNWWRRPKQETASTALNAPFRWRTPTPSANCLSGQSLYRDWPNADRVTDPTILTNTAQRRESFINLSKKLRANAVGQRPSDCDAGSQFFRRRMRSTIRSGGGISSQLQPTLVELLITQCDHRAGPVDLGARQQSSQQGPFFRCTFSGRQIPDEAHRAGGRHELASILAEGRVKNRV